MIDKFKLTELDDKMTKTYDLFICFCSFENRCISVPKSINISKIKKALVFYNEEIIEYVNQNKSVVEELFGKKGQSVSLLHSNPIYTADKMKNAMQSIKEDMALETESILIDVTTFTHEALLIIIKLLQIVFPTANITCVYANAYEYDSANEKNSKWLSKGISEIRSVLGYSGNIFPAQKTHLIIIVGYEYERASSIINELEPSSIALGFGRSNNATTQKDIDANEHYTHLVEQMASNYSDIDCFEVMCNDPFATCEVLTYHINNNLDKNILIVPLNNKISTIGVSLSAIKNENVQLCYAPALTYNYEDYSKAGDSCYLFDITDALKI